MANYVLTYFGEPTFQSPEEGARIVTVARLLTGRAAFSALATVLAFNRRRRGRAEPLVVSFRDGE